ncbi:HigA family addiction module antitoxin [Novosphingobium olei]|uniref:HigA family addiction module antidote protein n=1 Tax=Novosphingobium olei TaxID=2728851 RepID=A0A7Y0G9D9_9SPHN|nr:HigA family addiction module antitoxin [Novosphingobium olei]NML93905.1 HigA family addiction module antidote protein [Novosphingobium olei]
MSKSPTTTEMDELHNPHAGELLASEFLEPLALAPSELASAIGVDVTRLLDVIEGRARIDGELDLRLARYFRMSEGFFLRLQDQFELREAKRNLHDDLDRIVPRAA